MMTFPLHPNQTTPLPERIAPPTPRKKRSSYTVRFKLNVLKFAYETVYRVPTTISKISKFFKVPQSTITGWKKQWALLRESSRKSTRRTNHLGGKCRFTKEKEAAMVEVIMELRDSLIPITRANCISVLRSEFPDDFAPFTKGDNSWLTRFMRRNRLSYRRITSQTKTADIEDIMAISNGFFEFFEDEVTEELQLRGLTSDDLIILNAYVKFN